MDPETAREAAAMYQDRGWVPIPLHPRGKAPLRSGWQKSTVSSVDPVCDVAESSNVGVVLGDPSCGLVDVDLDSDRAISVADALLPSTLMFGRQSRPRSHRLYTVDDALRTTKFRSPVGAMLVELRSTGAQTMFPPSVHPDGTSVEFETWPVQPTKISSGELRRKTAKVAAATLLAETWPSSGSRHTAALALSGGLTRAGWSIDDVVEFVGAVACAADDDEVDDRVQCALHTMQRASDGVSTTGWKTLRDIVGSRNVDQVLKWLDLGDRLHSTACSAGSRKNQASTPQTTRTEYFEEGGETYWLKSTRNGPQRVRLANFTARILQSIQRDDGYCEFEIRAVVGGKRKTFCVPASEYAKMDWVCSKLGAGAILSAGQGVRDRLRNAIQVFSESTLEEVCVRTRTGWHDDPEGNYFVSGRATIAAGGVRPDVAVRLPPQLASYALPDPPAPDRLDAAVTASLEMASLSPAAIVLLGAVFRAPLGKSDFAVHLVGRTGIFKTETAALAQQHFGASMQARNLPGSWGSTPNALGELLGYANDVVLVVDDFAPRGSTRQVQRMNATADTVIRGVGNGSARARLDRNISLRPCRTPGCALVTTGEEVPCGESLRARMVVVRMTAKTTSADALTRCQRDAEIGLYAESMAAYVRWLAGRFDTMGQWCRRTASSLHPHLVGGHRRIARAVAELGVGLAALLNFARCEGVIDTETAEAKWREWWIVLVEVVNSQAELVRETKPVERFRELLASAIASGAAHLARPDGTAPQEASRWGWRVSSHPGQRAIKEAGNRVGWVDGNYMYLDRQAAYRVVSEFGHATGEALGVSVETLVRQLAEADVLEPTPPRAGASVKRTIEGRRRYVLSIPVGWLDSDDSVDEVGEHALPPPALPERPRRTGAK